MSGRPLITLAMPVFNGERYLNEAITSILAQTFGDFELVVTDNASTDATREIIEDFIAVDKRITYLHNGTNLGAAQNYNRGYQLAASKYLKWCAHDDLLSPNLLEECVRSLEDDPSISVAFGSPRDIDTEGRLGEYLVTETPSILSEDPSTRFAQVFDLAGTSFPIFGLMRKSFLDRSTLHRPYYGSDRALLAELAILGKFQKIDTATFYNRNHPMRSLAISDRLERSRWQNGEGRRIASAEQLNLFRHLFEITGRHKDIVEPRHLRKILLSRFFRPVNLQRFGIDIAVIVSPKLASALKSVLASRSGRRYFPSD